MTTAHEVMSEIRYALSELGASCDFSVEREAIGADGTVPLIILDNGYDNDQGEQFTVIVIKGDVTEYLLEGASLEDLVE